MRILRYTVSCFGIILLSLGSSLCLSGNLGVDPFTSANIALSNVFNVGLGIFQLSINTLLLLIIIFSNHSFIGFGTLINMISVGYLIQFFTYSLNEILLKSSSVILSVAQLFIGILVLTLGASLYFKSDLGVAPYDAIGLIISKKTNINFRYCRIFTDIVLVIISLVFHGPFGIATICIALFTGPLIDYWNKILERLIKKYVSFKKKDIFFK